VVGRRVKLSIYFLGIKGITIGIKSLIAFCVGSLLQTANKRRGFVRRNKNVTDETDGKRLKIKELIIACYVCYIVTINIIV